MTTEQQDVAAQNTKRRRGPKTYPLIQFEDVLALARTIHDEGVSPQMRRVTLFTKLGKGPGSSQSRALVSASARYGLTIGSEKAQQISITEVGEKIAADAPSFTNTRNLIFEHAISKFDPFNQLYGKLTDKRVPSDDLLVDELLQIGLDAADSHRAAEIFLANARFVGLIQELGGTQRFIPIEQVLEESVAKTEEAPSVPEASLPPAADLPTAQSPQSALPQEPSLHIDVQVHIDSTATADQIDQIFASMAKHLYGRDS